MNRTIFAITLSLTSSVALADGFAPWNGHTTVMDAASAGTTAVPATGFAPWRDRTPILDRADGASITDARDTSVFRPWQMPS